MFVRLRNVVHFGKIKHFITAIENKGLKYIFVLFELKHTEFLTSHGGYLLNTTLKAPGAGFSGAGLGRAKCGFYRFQRFLLIVVIVISILLKSTF